MLAPTAGRRLGGLCRLAAVAARADPVAALVQAAFLVLKGTMRMPRVPFRHIAARSAVSASVCTVIGVLEGQLLQQLWRRRLRPFQ